MSYIIKTAPQPAERGAVLRIRERPFYDGEDIRVGDEAFVWFSETERGDGLSWISVVERITPIADKLELQVRLQSKAVSSFTQSNLEAISDIEAAVGESGLKNKLRKHSHNKIAALTSEEAAILHRQFSSYNNLGSAAFRIHWTHSDAKDYVDYLPLKYFLADGSQHGVEHEGSMPDGTLYAARCDIENKGNVSRIDYIAHKKFNKDRNHYIGVLILRFQDTQRTTIGGFSWEDEQETIHRLSGNWSVVTVDLVDIDLIDSAEGGLRLVTHLSRERDQTLVRKKKSEILDRLGYLSCEVCKFDFEGRYGGLGKGFCEVHHKRPISLGVRQTSLSDLIILCSNCHRMIHRAGCISIEEFREKHFRP